MAEHTGEKVSAKIVIVGCNSLSVSLQVGKISKRRSGVLKEAFTDADNFGISFPMDLDVKIKATLLGAVFLIDFMFFEVTKRKMI